MEKQIIEKLSTIMDPDLGKDIVSLGFIKNLDIKNGDVSFDIELTTPACPVKDQLKKEAEDKVKSIPGVKNLAIKMTSRVRTSQSSQAKVLTQVKNVLAVSSAKGGVGKSTTAVNLALALSNSGAKVGLMDADIYGPSACMMLGITTRPLADENQRIYPVDVKKLKVISMAMFTNDESPVVWRGPMVSGMVMQFLSHVEWGELDYLIIDLPPGTGDIQLTLTQQCPLSGAVIVTTPQDVALLDARRGLKMFESVQVPVLGIIENMSSFICDGCGKEHHLFGKGGGERLKNQMGVPLLGQIPLYPELVESCDLGVPIFEKHPNHPVIKAYKDLAGRVASQLSIWSENMSKALVDIDTTWENLPSRIASETPEELIPEYPLPMDIFKTPQGKLAITWIDGAVSFFDLPTLRDHCACANCQNEWTGERIRKVGASPSHIHPKVIKSVGRYALLFDWSDGHSTGIYSFGNLRKLSQENLK